MLLATRTCSVAVSFRVRRPTRSLSIGSFGSPSLHDPDALNVHELADPELAELAAEAGVLHAAEGQTRIGYDHSINEQESRLDLGDELIAFTLVARPCRCTQPKSGSVRDPDRIGDVLRLEDRSNWTE